MNKRLWISVGSVVGGLGVVSVVSRWKEIRAMSWPDPAPALAALERGLGGAWWPALAAIGGGLVLVAAVGVAVRRRRRAARGGFAEPWRTVIEMSKKGQGASTIAQATGLPHDAVRIMLGPIALDPSMPRGKSFRSSPPDDLRTAAERGLASKS